MKLLLCSNIEWALPKLYKLAQRKKNYRAGIIFNARDKKAPEYRSRKLKTLDNRLSVLGYRCTEIDLRDFDRNEVALLRARLLNIDLLIVGGGSVSALRNAMHTSGFDDIILSLKNSDLIYVGESAGAVVCAGMILPYLDQEQVENNEAPTEKGLGLLSYVPVPHFNESGYRLSVEKVVNEIKQTEALYKPINEDQIIEEII